MVDFIDYITSNSQLFKHYTTSLYKVVITLLGKSLIITTKVKKLVILTLHNGNILINSNSNNNKTNVIKVYYILP